MLAVYPPFPLEPVFWGVGGEEKNQDSPPNSMGYGLENFHRKAKQSKLDSLPLAA